MKEQEALLYKVIDLFAERFDKHAVLHGGMVLRVLGCERMTNDLDYVFVPFKSKKDIVSDVVTTLKQLEDARVSYTLNSKCLRATVEAAEARIQVEVKTALAVPTSVVSTKDFAANYGYSARLIPVVDYSVALANKMAAWNERRLIRDIYDIWFYLKIGVRPDFVTLKARLDKPQYSRLVRKTEHFQGGSVQDFFAFLNSHVQGLTDEEISDSLSDYLSPEDIPGLAMRFRSEIAKLL